ncbi:glycosyltransferase [Methylobacterium sp. J-077]|uniref:glycosyltransferase n=1 Tax=Methylobacterium sp. J-077 TaxID=2836656 RepID=UPI001FBBF18B|nr:glycosyltransferase [Methylobacterium sp. J-077]MCJ2123042.1 glycosyl transferase family 28 [Methylobacterium sp. J-077]
MRVLIVVTHLLGAGHLTRAAALGRAFAAAGHEVLLVTGGVPAPMVRLGDVRLVQLPPLHVAGTDFARPLGPDGLPAEAALFARRRALLLDTLAEFAPDAVITELFPFGRRALADEFLALVEAAHARRRRPLVLASVRDILVASAKPERIAQAHARVARLYDAVLVHGDPALVPLEASWPLDAGTAEKLRYTGYVDEGSPAHPAATRAGVLVAAGSGPAGLGLLRAAAEAARLRPSLGWLILAGHGVPESELSAIGRGLPAGTIERARPDYRLLLAGAALSVSQCGYNTAIDLLATATPAVLVPFAAGGETEQRLRAECLAARGLARVLPEAELTAESLLRTVDAQLSAPAPGPHGIDLGGAARTVAIVVEILAARAGEECQGLPDAAEVPSPERERGLVADGMSASGNIVGGWVDELPASPDRTVGANHALLPPPSAGEGGPRRGSGEGRAASSKGAPGDTSANVAPPLSPPAAQGTLPRRGGRESARSGFAALRKSVDEAAARGRRVRFWWRDDDAVAASPALDRLTDLAEAHAVPLLLAAIPAGIEPSLGERLASAETVRVAVHGLAHHNHAPPGEKPAEFGPHRRLDALMAEAAAGLRIARERLPDAALLPVFVPPWNRLAPDLAAALPELGYRGLSAVPGPAIPGLVRADATLDPIDWRGTRSLRDPEALLRDLAAQIAGDPLRPVGLLTHHRAHDAAIWAFLAALLAVFDEHPAVTVLDPQTLFCAAAVDTGEAGSTLPFSPAARTG